MNRSTRTLLVVLIALVTASVASFGVYRAVQRIPVREVEVASVQIVVAKTHLPVGSLVTADSAKLAAWPKASQVPGAFASIDQVVNRGVILPIGENEPITQAKLAPVGAGTGLAPTIPEGMRAVSVKVNEVIGVAGFVIPGSRVDVLVTVSSPGAGGSMTRAVVSNVEVLTSGTRMDQEKAQADGKPIPATVVTLLATPDDAEKITLAATEGKVMLTLRNPLDKQRTETSGIRIQALTGAAPAPQPEIKAKPSGRKAAVPVKAAVTQPAPEPTNIVEAIRAGKRGNEVVKDDIPKKDDGAKKDQGSTDEVVKK